MERMENKIFVKNGNSADRLTGWLNDRQTNSNTYLGQSVDGEKYWIILLVDIAAGCGSGHAILRRCNFIVWTWARIWKAMATNANVIQYYQSGVCICFSELFASITFTYWCFAMNQWHIRMWFRSLAAVTATHFYCSIVFTRSAQSRCFELYSLLFSFFLSFWQVSASGCVVRMSWSVSVYAIRMSQRWCFPSALRL